MRLRNAVDYLGSSLHEEISRHIPDSQNKCILSAHVARAFLKKAGFEADLMSVSTYLFEGRENTKVNFGAVVGREDALASADEWAGHLVVVLPREEYLIDVTLYTFQPPKWRGPFGMFAVPFARSDQGSIESKPIIGYVKQIAGASKHEIIWVKNDKNSSWRSRQDARATMLHRTIVDAMLLRQAGKITQPN